MSNPLTSLDGFLILHYIAASAIVFTFAIVNLTRAFMAVNPLAYLIGVDSIYILLS